MIMFRKLITLEKALERIKRNIKIKPLGIEEVSLMEAYSRILAEDIIAPIDVPHFRRSTMDGYAVRAEDTFGASEDNPKKLKLVNKIEIGELAKVKVGFGEAVEVSTGSMVPEGANAVLMLEHAEKINNEIIVFKATSPGENIIEVGFDIKKGEKILFKGEFLSARKLGILASLGIPRVKVYRKPKVAIISTGCELLSPGNQLKPGKIYDINSTTISASVVECGGIPNFLGIFADKYEDIRKVVSSALSNYDIVILSGGTSVGVTDIVREVINGLGEPGIIIDGVRIKPGKPTIVGVVKRKPIFCLPGHPMSSLMTFHIFVAPVIRGFSGMPNLKPKIVKAELAVRVIPASGRINFIPVKLIRENGKLKAYPILKGSSAITSLAKADGYFKTDINANVVLEGKQIEVYLFPDFSLGGKDID